MIGALKTVYQCIYDAKIAIWAWGMDSHKKWTRKLPTSILHRRYYKDSNSVLDNQTTFAFPLHHALQNDKSIGTVKLIFKHDNDAPCLQLADHLGELYRGGNLEKHP